MILTCTKTKTSTFNVRNDVSEETDSISVMCAVNCSLNEINTCICPMRTENRNNLATTIE